MSPSNQRNVTEYLSLLGAISHFGAAWNEVRSALTIRIAELEHLRRSISDSALMGGATCPPCSRSGSEIRHVVNDRNGFREAFNPCCDP
jgi:hypothetical protein